MAAAAATFMHKDKHAHDRVEDTTLYGWDEDHDFLGYAGDVYFGGEYDSAYDVNTL